MESDFAQGKWNAGFRYLQLLLGLFLLVFFALPRPVLAQELTGSIEGTIKDPSGAVVPQAVVKVSGPTLVGTKTTTSDTAGYYRFANLPPGSYTITVTAKGFATAKRSLALAVGGVPTVDFTLKVGLTSTVVTVKGGAPLIDTTQSRTMTDLTPNVLSNIPHGLSYQSVIQFAPSARNEPLQGGQTPGAAPGNGGCSPGSCSNGQSFGYSIGGAADSENGYLVNGQNTANVIGGYSFTQLPFDFINEVQVKTTGIQAQYGGALGGVVNVITKQGTDKYHGTVDVQYQSSALSASRILDVSRYDPSAIGTATSWGQIDPPYQQYTAKKDTRYYWLPGFTFGGPMPFLKHRVFFFTGFNPEFTQDRRTVNVTYNNLGPMEFARNRQTYYTTARVDVAVTHKLRAFGSWYYAYQRESGLGLPQADSIQGYVNQDATSPPSAFAHSIGYSAPNNTMNFGVDWTITPRIIWTTKLGYYFENFKNFGYPTGGTTYSWSSTGIGGTDALGNPLPANLQQANGFITAAANSGATSRNASKRTEIDQDIAFYKSGWWGTHDFIFGYQFLQDSSSLHQGFNQPFVFLNPGTTVPYSPQGPVGQANCAPFVAQYGACVGLYGVLTLQDYGDGGYALSRNHSFFAQDSWTVGHGLTLNLGFRIEKEYLPAENQPGGRITEPIQFGWGDKIAPRLGAAWDVFRNGKLKIFGSYGVFNDIMKLNLAISSFGGEFWQNCAYALNTADYTSIIPAYDSNTRYCAGASASSQGSFQGGGTPSGITFLENQNFRTFPTTCSTCSETYEGVAPGLKPYREHESTLGAEYELPHQMALSIRWDRRRLDHAIEDASIFNPLVGETFVVVNPGQGVDKTFNSFYNFLYGQPSGCASLAQGCPPANIPAQRNYDGLEFRLTMSPRPHWAAMFSYTYSRLWGNYSGLTSSYFGDGLGGRNAPNNSRAFDEPFFQYDSYGNNASGLMPTDRPNTFKGWLYYNLNEGSRFGTDLGLFASMYQGTPQTSVADVGYAFSGYPLPSFPTAVVGYGKWIDVSQNSSTGAITMGSPRTLRTPWFDQADISVGETFHIDETKKIRFFVNVTNLFNRRATTAYFQQIDSWYNQNFLTPGGYSIFDAAAFYSAVEHPYNLLASMNSSYSNTTAGGSGPGPVTVSSQYGKPFMFQPGRQMYLGLRITF